MSRHSLNEHLWLIGYRGSGKTSVARSLATRLGCALIDTDDMIEQIAGRSIAEIFAESGESVFREIESQAISQAAELPPQVIASGGGAILREENRLQMRSTGTVVWLDASPETLLQRLQDDADSRERRPALTDRDWASEVRHVMQQRQPLYQQTSHVRVDVSDASIDAVVNAILTRTNVN